MTQEKGKLLTVWDFLNKPIKISPLAVITTFFIMFLLGVIV